MRVNHNFFLVPGSRSTFPDTDLDPDPDPAKWYGSNRIRIRNTGFKETFLYVPYSKFFFPVVYNFTPLQWEVGLLEYIPMPIGSREGSVGYVGGSDGFAGEPGRAGGQYSHQNVLDQLKAGLCYQRIH